MAGEVSMMMLTGEIGKYSKTCLKWPLKRRQKMGFKTDYRLMQVKSIAECSSLQGEHSAILLTSIKLQFVIKIFVVFSIFDWSLKTGFTVSAKARGCLEFVFFHSK